MSKVVDFLIDVSQGFCDFVKMFSLSCLGKFIPVHYVMTYTKGIFLPDYL